MSSFHGTFFCRASSGVVRAEVQLRRSEIFIGIISQKGRKLRRSDILPIPARPSYRFDFAPTELCAFLQACGYKDCAPTEL
jgi:hypothetical protein